MYRKYLIKDFKVSNKNYLTENSFGDFILFLSVISKKRAAYLTAVLPHVILDAYNNFINSHSISFLHATLCKFFLPKSK